MDSLLDVFRRKVKERGAKGIIGLGRLFKIMDDNHNHQLELDEFKKAIKDFRLRFDNEDIPLLFKEFDRDRSGSIDYDEFLRTIRVNYNSVKIIFFLREK